MRYSWFLLGLFVLSFAAVFRPTFAPVADPSTGASPLAASEIVETLETGTARRLLSDSVPGVSIAVASADGRETAWTAGRISAWSAEPVGPETLFEGASLSKPVTAYAVLRLVQDGLLDLDVPVVVDGHDFTLRQVLSHQGGFDNAMSSPHVPSGEPGAFTYAGTGFLYLGQEIERVTGRDFADYMNTVVLPELGMSHSHFGVAETDASELATPHVSIALPFMVFAALTLIVGLSLLLLHTGICRLFHLNGFWAGKTLPRLFFALAVLAGMAVPALLLGTANRPVILLALGSMLGLAGAVVLTARSGTVAGRIVAVVLAALMLGIFALRPPIPLHQRQAHFLPAAGLRTTPTDYARFLSHIIRPSALDPALAAEMLTPQVAVNAQHDWGLGVGIQRGEVPVIWHWGINFPGYQSFAVAYPQTGDVMVVMTNGGPMSITANGYRYAGLELARDAVIAIEGGEHSAYWQGVQ